MPSNHFEGFAPQFAAVQVIKPAEKLSSDIYQGNTDVTKFMHMAEDGSTNVHCAAYPVLDRVSKDRVNNSSSCDRHYLVAVRGIMSAFLPVDLTSENGRKTQNLRRLCRHTHPEDYNNEKYAWFQVQVTSGAPKC